MAQLIDDRNSAIVYSPGWTGGGVSSEYESTTTYTQRAGVNATLTFHGVSVAVFGSIGPRNSSTSPPLSSYTIDGYENFIFEPTLSADWQHHIRFFQSPLLRNDTQTLLMTSLRNDSDIYVLDYFVVGSNTSYVTSTSATLELSSSSSITLSQTPTATPLGNSMRNPRISTATFAISITAAVSGIILLIAIIHFFLRRRKRRGSNANIISMFCGDKPQLPDLPRNRLVNLAHSTNQDPPPYDLRPANGTSRFTAPV